MGDLIEIVLAIVAGLVVWYATLPFQRAAAEKKLKEKRRQTMTERRIA